MVGSLRLITCVVRNLAVWASTLLEMITSSNIENQNNMAVAEPYPDEEE
jgi:hypothetical protein